MNFDNFPCNDLERLKIFLINKLHEGVVTITFTKQNGEERVMDCTLSDRLIPESAPLSSDISLDNDYIRVYDVISDGWRTFKWKSLIDFRIHE